MKKKLSILFLFVFSSFLYSECLWRVIEKKVYTKSCDTKCIKSENGNCYQWDIVYCNSTENSDVCKESCNLKECKNWEEKQNIEKPHKCQLATHCNAFSGPDLGSPCISWYCPVELTEINIYEKKCKNAICG